MRASQELTCKCTTRVQLVVVLVQTQVAPEGTMEQERATTSNHPISTSILLRICRFYQNMPGYSSELIIIEIRATPTNSLPGPKLGIMILNACMHPTRFLSVCLCLNHHPPLLPFPCPYLPHVPVCCLVLDLSTGFILAPHMLVLAVAAASTGLTRTPHALVLQMLLPPQALHSVLAQVLAASCRAS